MPVFIQMKIYRTPTHDSADTYDCINHHYFNGKSLIDENTWNQSFGVTITWCNIVFSYIIVAVRYGMSLAIYIAFCTVLLFFLSFAFGLVSGYNTSE